MFKITTSVHDMKCIQIKNPSNGVRTFLRSIVTCNWIHDDDYKVSKKAGAFLQCDYPDYILIEFWNDGAEYFVDYINEKWRKQ